MNIYADSKPFGKIHYYLKNKTNMQIVHNKLYHDFLECRNHPCFIYVRLANIKLKLCSSNGWIFYLQFKIFFDNMTQHDTT